MKSTLLTLAATSLLATTAFADPIHSAAWDGDLAGVQAELDKGVNVHAKSEGGSTPLHLAAFKGHKEIVELLIDAGADVNAKADDAGVTPLHHAANKEIIELLISKGADVNAKNTMGETPLHQAAEKGHKEIAELLIANGADVNAKSRDGHMRMPMTPLDKAKGEPWDSAETKATKKEISDLLREHGGKPWQELWALMPRLVQHGQFAFSFVAKEGKVYEVQDSVDLLNWYAVKTYIGTDASVRFDEDPRKNLPSIMFYRVRVVE